MNCLVCGANSETIETTGDVVSLACPRCGEYDVSHSVIAAGQLRQLKPTQRRDILDKAKRSAARGARPFGHLFGDFPVKHISVQRSQPRTYGVYQCCHVSRLASHGDQNARSPVGFLGWNSSVGDESAWHRPDESVPRPIAGEIARSMHRLTGPWCSITAE
jgi:hypothetical protein